MARNAKSGLEYFPFDIDFFQDIRIRKLIKRQSGKAVTVYALLLCLIYKDGYYMQWDDELPFICSELSGFDEAFISEVINTCLALGLFDKATFEAERVLTSKGIQQRYCNVQRLNKRMSRIDNYALFSADNAKAAPGSKQHKSAKAKQAVAQSPTPTPEPVAPEVAAPQPPTPKPPRAAASADADADGNQTWLKEFFADTHHENLMMLCKNFGLPFGDIPGLRTLAEAVVSEWELSATEHVSYNDFSRHLISTMRKKFNDSRRPSPSASSAPADTPPQAPASNYNFSGGFGGVDV